MDIDCLIRAEEGQLALLAKRMEEAGFFVELEDLLAMNKGEGHATIEHQKTMFRLDMFAAKDRFASITLAESIEVDLKGEMIRISSPETTIVSKLRFGSPQDIKDAEGIYGRLHGSLDNDKLESYARLVGVKEELTSFRERMDRLLESGGQTDEGLSS